MSAIRVEASPRTVGRSALLVDGIFVVASGVVLALFGSILADRLEAGAGAWFHVAGVVFMAYGGWLTWRVWSRPYPAGLLAAVATVNSAWVAGSLLVLALRGDDLSAAMAAVVAVAAIAVGGLAVVQWLAWVRERR